MATAYTLIRRALRLCKAVDAAEAVPALDAQDALDTLNAMLAEWHAAGIGLPDYSLASVETELASDAADAEAIAYQLSGRLAPEYGKELPPLVATIANESMNRLRLRYFQPGTTNYSELPSSQPSRYNIEAGE